MMPAPASVVLQNVDRVPLSLNYVGGIALTINFVECPSQCTECPWSANLDRRVAKILDLGVLSERIQSILHRSNPDVVVLHGADPLLEPRVQDLISTLRRCNARLCIKIRALLAEKEDLNILNPLDIALLELVDEHDLEVLAHSLKLLEDRTSNIEYVLLVHDFNTANTMIHGLATRNLLRHPLNIVLVKDVNILRLASIIDKVRKTYIHVYVPLAPSTDLASVQCPKCRMYVVLRRSGVVAKSRLKGAYCDYCGTQVLRNVAKRIVKVPIEEVVL